MVTRILGYIALLLIGVELRPRTNSTEQGSASESLGSSIRVVFRVRQYLTAMVDPAFRLEDGGARQCVCKDNEANKD